MPNSLGFHSTLILYSLGNTKGFGFQIQSNPCEECGGHVSFQEVFVKIVLKDWSFLRIAADFGD